MLDSLFAPNISKMQSRSDVKGLLKALAHKNEKVRAEAARALGELRDASAVGALVLLLDDESPLVRGAASDALVCIGKPAVDALIAQLARVDGADGWRYWRGASYAALALGKIGDARAFDPLIAHLHPAKETRIIRYAAEALGLLGDARANEALLSLFGYIYEIQAVKEKSSNRMMVFGKDSTYDYYMACRAAAAALTRLGWQPGSDKDGAMYFALTRQYERCAAIGEPAAQAVNALYCCLWYLEGYTESLNRRLWCD
jgi:hypothetical protein